MEKDISYTKKNRYWNGWLIRDKWKWKKGKKKGHNRSYLGILYKEYNVSWKISLFKGSQQYNRSNEEGHELKKEIRNMTEKKRKQSHNRRKVKTW